MRALSALVLLGQGLGATCLLPPLARMMQASERVLVNDLDLCMMSALRPRRAAPYIY